MAPFGKVYYDEGWSVLFPDALAHGDAADTDPGLYWNTVAAFVEKYVSLGREQDRRTE